MDLSIASLSIAVWKIFSGQSYIISGDTYNCENCNYSVKNVRTIINLNKNIIDRLLTKFKEIRNMFL